MKEQALRLWCRAWDALAACVERASRVIRRQANQARELMREDRAQGTTEYAILVGVLVVIAILAIVAFRDRLSELWDAISSGINSL